MRLTTRVGLLAGASALALGGASFADNSATAQDQEARIAELEAKVAQLNGNDWLTEERANEIRGLVQDVLADADTRASLLQGAGVGYDDGFVLGDPNGNFGLKINGQIQFRHVMNSQDDAVPGDQNTRGFENTRTKLAFTGNAGDWMFRVSTNFGQLTQAGGPNAGNDGVADLEDAFLGYDFGNGWSVYLGQGKVPLSREQMVDSKDQLAVERSLSSYVHPHGRTQGILLDYKMDQFHFMGSYNDGAAGVAAFPGGFLNGATQATYVTALGYANAPAIPNAAYPVPDTEYAVTLRGEMLFSGNWEQFEDFTSPQGSEQGMMAGISFHFQDDESGNPATGVLGNGVETEVWALAADFSLEMDGWNAFVGFNWTNFDSNVIGTTDQDLVSLVLQGGFYLNETMELFLRYEWTDYDLPAPAVGFQNADDLSLITVGLNAYYTDNVKLSTDISFGLNEIWAGNALTGLNADGPANQGVLVPYQDGQFVWRTQFQLTF
ncbi:MAG: hypothetical protein GY715_11405 [Planctomycetes bacterium]|nr:hypothetical protein [Planctomycetota bacterium]